jgi:hypothetical protein
VATCAPFFPKTPLCLLQLPFISHQVCKKLPEKNKTQRCVLLKNKLISYFQILSNPFENPLSHKNIGYK